MKKLLFIVFVALISLNANAQKGTKAIGLNLGYGTDIESLNIGVKGLYGITDNVEGEASFTYFLENEGAQMWNISADAHYLFPLQDKLTVYPLAGLSYIHVGFDCGGILSASDSKLGFDLGGGIRYDMTDNIALNAELKYQFVSLYDQLLLSVGVAYKF